MLAKNYFKIVQSIRIASDGKGDKIVRSNDSSENDIRVPGGL